MAQAKKKKKFFDIDMPIIGKNTQLLAFEPEDLEGKEIKYDLTRILKGKSVMLQLKVILKEGKPTSIPKELKVISYYIRRMIRKGTDYVEDSFKTNCTDAEILIKPFLITRRKVSNAVKKALREAAKEEIISEFKKKGSEEIFEDLLRNKFQKSLSLKLKKIYPLSLCEIRNLKVLKEIPKNEKE
jgi:ribosomal protein S3AE